MGRLTSLWNSFKGTKDSSDISIRKTLGPHLFIIYFFLHKLEWDLDAHLQEQWHGHTAECDRA